MAGLLLASDVSPELIGTSFEGIRSAAVALIELTSLDTGGAVLLNPSSRIVMGKDVAARHQEPNSVSAERHLDPF